MKYLFIDTSSFYINLAIIIDYQIVINFKKKNSPELSENIFVYLNKIFSESKIQMKDLDKIFVTVGPGSFTGTRVGLTIAKTVAWTLKLPVVPISTLELYASTKRNEEYLISFINDRNDYLYVGIYKSSLGVYMNDKYMSFGKLKKIINNLNNYVFIGYDQMKDYEVVIPQIDILKIIKLKENDIIENVHLLKPNYLKMIQAWRDLKNKELAINER